MVIVRLSRQRISCLECTLMHAMHKLRATELSFLTPLTLLVCVSACVPSICASSLLAVSFPRCAMQLVAPGLCGAPLELNKLFCLRPLNDDATLETLPSDASIRPLASLFCVLQLFGVLRAVSFSA
eukprot:6181152-Pleurochrysis_carterae.AAC.1